MGVVLGVVTAAMISVSWAEETPRSRKRDTGLLKPSRSESLDLRPSNPLGIPGSAGLRSSPPSMIPISSGMFSGILPHISNLDFGFMYAIGDSISTGSISADYLVPISRCPSSMIFGEAHVQYAGFWTSPMDGAPALIDAANRLDVSLGGGYRRRLTWEALVGVNAFLDSSRIFHTWYSSWGWGVEAAYLTSSDCAVDFTFNMYGMQFNRRMLTNAFRNHGTSFDVHAGYARPLFNKTLDLRVELAGYQFDTGNKNYGFRVGTEVTTRSGLFRLTYDFGYDPVNEAYHQFGGFVNLSLNLENLLCGKGVISLPPPVFVNPRNPVRMATKKVERNWHQPTAVILANDAIRGTAENLAGPELMLVASRTNAPGAISLLSAGSAVLYSRFNGPPVWTGSTVTSTLLDRLKRVEILVHVVTADAGAPDFSVGIRFVNPHTGASSDRMSGVPVPGNSPAGTTVVRVLDESDLAGLADMDGQGFVRVRPGAYAGPFRYRVTVNFYR